MMLNTETPAPEGNKEIAISRNRLTVGKFLIRYNALVILVVLIIVATLISPVFLTGSNLFNVFRQQATYMMIAIGMLLVILTGGIDLSVSAMAAIGSIMIALALKNWGFDASGWGLAAAILIGVVSCVIFGAINGFLVAQVKVPAFIVTLATMTAAQGVAFILTNGTTVVLDQDNPMIKKLIHFAENLDPILGIPYPVYLAAAVVIIFGLIMGYTTFGRLIYATGSNETAVLLAGINTKKYKFWSYTICGGLCGLAGLVITARTASATPITVSVDYNMSSIASVVIGGASLNGGEGTVLFTVVGVLIIAVIGNIMNLVSLAVYPQMIVKAAIIVLAVVLKGFSSKRG